MTLMDDAPIRRDRSDSAEESSIFCIALSETPTKDEPTADRLVLHFMAPRNDKFDPQQPKSRTDRISPILLRLLMLKDEPNCNTSSKDVVEPNLAVAYADTPQLLCIKSRKEKDEPITV
jgi:hypothetical protein